MKRLLVIAILLACISTVGYSQAKTEFGITAEGSWFMPKESTGDYHWATKDGFGTGIGIYASRDIFGRFSADIGLSYRYKQMKQNYMIYSKDADRVNEFGYSILGDAGCDKLPMHYIVVPVHLQMRLHKGFFVRSGVEATWLTNYKNVNEKPEYNWTIGFGGQVHNLKLSVNYIRGFKEQGFGDNARADGHIRGSINRNNMVQVSVSCPIWKSK